MPRSTKNARKGRNTNPKGHVLGFVNPLVAAIWHPQSNGDTTPFDVSPKIDRWWKCPLFVGNRKKESLFPDVLVGSEKSSILPFSDFCILESIDCYSSHSLLENVNGIVRAGNQLHILLLLANRG